jgi:hypothetical protein
LRFTINSLAVNSIDSAREFTSTAEVLIPCL